MTDHFRSVDRCTITRNSDGGPKTMAVTFARFGEWNMIHDGAGNRFLERLERGAFADTFAERGPAGSGMIRALFQHGRDPSVGDKPLGKVVELVETERGPVGVVELLDRPYVDDIVAGVEAGVYGASYRFGVDRENDHWDHAPARSDWNPEGLPERTITKLRVAEMGPVTFPADEATNDPGMVGVRSLDGMFADVVQNAVDLAPGAAETAQDSVDAAAIRRADAERLFLIGEAARRNR